MSVTESFLKHTLYKVDCLLFGDVGIPRTQTERSRFQIVVSDPTQIYINAITICRLKSTLRKAAEMRLCFAIWVLFISCVGVYSESTWMPGNEEASEDIVSRILRVRFGLDF